MLRVLKQYLPVIGMVLVTVISVFVTAASDNKLTTNEVGNLVLALLGAITVYVVPRLAGVHWLKPAVAGATALVQAILSAWIGGITMSEWGTIILTVLGALGVMATNKYVPVTVRPKAVQDVTY